MSDLDDIYSDLSDNEQQKKPQPQPKANEKPSLTQQQPQTLIKMPAFLGGKAFIPPPPPPSSKPMPRSTAQQQAPSSRHQQQNYHQQNQRQRKNTIYIKNIPKTYNRQETLTTFFRTYGNIKSIKTNQQSSSAVIRFEKQQDAYKFMTAKPLILNRSYIVYDMNQDFRVQPQKIVQREKQQNIAIVNTSEKEVLILKENTEYLLADKYRCLLFLYKNRNMLTEQKLKQIQKQMDRCRKLKQSESTDKQYGQMLANLENDYDWTLSFEQITKQAIQKKRIITQFSKYGPISTINIKLNQMLAQPDEKNPSNENKLAIIKIKFLSVRNSWEMYIQNHQNLKLSVDGSKLNDVFKSWFVKKQEEKQQFAAKNPAQSECMIQDISKAQQKFPENQIVLSTQPAQENAPKQNQSHVSTPNQMNEKKNDAQIQAKKQGQNMKIEEKQKQEK